MKDVRSASERPDSFTMREMSSEDRMPSPVVAWSRAMMWPDCSPPSEYPEASISSST